MGLLMMIVSHVRSTIIHSQEMLSRVEAHVQMTTMEMMLQDHVWTVFQLVKPVMIHQMTSATAEMMVQIQR